MVMWVDKPRQKYLPPSIPLSLPFSLSLSLLLSILSPSLLPPSHLSLSSSLFSSFPLALPLSLAPYSLSPPILPFIYPSIYPALHPSLHLVWVNQSVAVNTPPSYLLSHPAFALKISKWQLSGVCHDNTGSFFSHSVDVSWVKLVI